MTRVSCLWVSSFSLVVCKTADCFVEKRGLYNDESVTSDGKNSTRMKLTRTFVILRVEYIFRNCHESGPSLVLDLDYNSYYSRCVKTVMR